VARSKRACAGRRKLRKVRPRQPRRGVRQQRARSRGADWACSEARVSASSSTSLPSRQKASASELFSRGGATALSSRSSLFTTCCAELSLRAARVLQTAQRGALTKHEGPPTSLAASSCGEPFQQGSLALRPAPYTLRRKLCVSARLRLRPTAVDKHPPALSLARCVRPPTSPRSPPSPQRLVPTHKELRGTCAGSARRLACCSEPMKTRRDALLPSPAPSPLAS